MKQFTTAQRGDFLNPASGAAGGSASSTLAAVNVDAVLAVWDSMGGTVAGGPATQATPLIMSPTIEVGSATVAAWDFNWMLLGRDSLPAAFTYADWRNGASVVVPPTRMSRAASTNGAPQPEPLHLFRYYVWAISANATGVAPAATVTCKARLTTLGVE